LANWQDLDALVLRLLAKEREQRPRDVAELVGLIDAVAYVAPKTRHETVGEATVFEHGRRSTVVEPPPLYTPIPSPQFTPQPVPTGANSRILKWAVVTILIAGLGIWAAVRFLPYKAPIRQVDMARVDNAIAMPDAAKEDAIVVTVRRDGEVWLGQNKTSIDVLGVQLRDRAADKPDHTMYLRADARAQFRAVEDVIDSMRTTGVDDVGLLVGKRGETSQKEYFACSKPPEMPRGLDVLTPQPPKYPPDPRETREMMNNQLTAPTRIPHDIQMVPKSSTEAAMPSRNESRTIVVQILYRLGSAPFYKINETDVAKAELLPRLIEIYANRAERVLFIKGDDNIDFRYVAEAIDIARSANVDHIGVMTPRILAGQ
jgi:biopolymer transport protein ExbD